MAGSASIRSFHTPQYRRFVVLLADARRDAGLSQSDLARRLGVDQSFVSKYESARRRLDVLEFLRIADAIEIDYRAILDKLSSEGLS